MNIDHNSNKPLHIQAEEILRNLIDSDEYKDGTYLPNEIELSQKLNISRNTLRQAINKLVFEGLLVRKKGVGTKIAHKSIIGGVKNWLSFSQEMKMLGIEIRNFELHICWKKPNEDICNFFNIDPQHPIKCIVLERVRGKKEYPFVYFISYFIHINHSLLEFLFCKLLFAFVGPILYFIFYFVNTFFKKI